MTDIKYGGTGPSHEWTLRAFPKAQVSATSLSVTPIEVMRLDGTLHCHGTAFIYRLEQERYLVTAWHVASGKDFFTRKLNSVGLIPTHLRIFIPGFEQRGNILNFKTEIHSLHLEEVAIAKLSNPPTVFGVAVDIAVGQLPFSLSKEGHFTSKGLNEFQWGIAERKSTPIQTSIGSDIFVLGYPLQTYEGACTPIWKRGSLASEPSFATTPKGSFLVDVNSAAGMSGGPIIRRVTTMTVDNRDLGVIQEHTDEAILGIYSGRALSRSDSSFVLGYGWPIDFVHEIIRTGQCFAQKE